MQKHTTWIDELDPIDAGLEYKTVMVYLAHEVDGHVAEIIARHTLKASQLEYRIEALTNEVAFLNETLEHNLERTSKLEAALRYWMPDETLVEPRHAAAWDEHVKLLQRSL